MVGFDHMSVRVYKSVRQGRLSSVIPELISARGLLFDLIVRDLRARYRNSIMGFLWAVLQPLATTAILTFVFTVAFGSRTPNLAVSGHPYVVLLLCGLVPWQFFSNALVGATRSLVDNQNLIKKVYFPRELIPIAAVANCLVSLFIGLALVLIVHAALGGSIGFGLAWLLLLVCIEMALVLGLALLCSCLQVRFRDVAYLVDVGLVFGFYATPIFYPLSWVESLLAEGHPWAHRLYLLNPMAGLVPAYQQALLDNIFPEFRLLAWPALFSLLALAGGAWAFRRSAPVMADYL
jgi:ABC-type polysaccharide/polyol phosphate export permease